MKKSKNESTIKSSSTALYVSGIPEPLKRKAKKAAIDNGIMFQDFIKIAIEHYLEYIENSKPEQKKSAKQKRSKVDLFHGDTL